MALQAQRDDRGRDPELRGRGKAGPERLPSETRRENMHGDVERDQQRRERDENGVLTESAQVYARAKDDEEERHHEALRDSGDLP